MVLDVTYPCRIPLIIIPNNVRNSNYALGEVSKRHTLSMSCFGLFVSLFYRESRTPLIFSNIKKALAKIIPQIMQVNIAKDFPFSRIQLPPCLVPPKIKFLSKLRGIRMTRIKSIA